MSDDSLLAEYEEANEDDVHELLHVANTQLVTNIRYMRDFYVEDFYDGDTFYGRIDNGFGDNKHDVALRLVGQGNRPFGTPEIRGRGRTAKERENAEKARRMVRTILTPYFEEGRPIVVETFKWKKPTRSRAKRKGMDNFGRYLLAVVQPFDIAAHLVEAGVGEWKGEPRA